MIMDLLRIYAERHSEIKVKLKFRFLDPDNLNLGWFREYYRSDTSSATFDDIIDRASVHPNFIHRVQEGYSPNRQFLLECYNRSSNDLILALCGYYNINYEKDIYYMNEIKYEFEDAVFIDYIESEDEALGDYDKPKWSLKYDTSALLLESSELTVKEAYYKLSKVLAVIKEKHFMGIPGGFTVEVCNPDMHMKHYHWFKAASLYNAKNIFDHFSRLSKEQRKSEIHRMFFNMREDEVCSNFEEIISRTIPSDVSFIDGNLNISLYSSSSYIKNPNQTVKFFNNIMTLVLEAIEPAFHRKQAIEKLKTTIEYLGIH